MLHLYQCLTFYFSYKDFTLLYINTTLQFTLYSVVHSVSQFVCMMK